LTAPLSILSRCPCLYGVLAKPDSNITAVSKKFLVLRPILDTVGCFILRMPIGYLVRLEHGRISIEIRVSRAYTVVNG